MLSVVVESAFGLIKRNHLFPRFLMKGAKEVLTNFGGGALAHNFLRVAASGSLLSYKRTRVQKVGRKTFFFSAQLFF
jgi:hypothetical protein